jgi:hypothetical protein
MPLPLTCRHRRCPGRPGRRAGRRNRRTRTGRPWLDGQDAGRRGGELGEGGQALGAPAEPMPAEDLLDAGGRQPDPALGHVVDQTPSADGGAGHGLGQHHLDLVGWGRGRHHRRPSVLGQRRSQAIALGAAGPAVVGGGPGDAEGGAGLGHAGQTGPFQDLDTPVVDDLCWGHGGRLLRLFGRNQGSTTGPISSGTCNLIP